MAYAQHLLANKFMRLHINLQLLSVLVAELLLLLLLLLLMLCTFTSAKPYSLCEANQKLSFCNRKHLNLIKWQAANFLCRNLWKFVGHSIAHKSQLDQTGCSEFIIVCVLNDWTKCFSLQLWRVFALLFLFNKYL